MQSTTKTLVGAIVRGGELARLARRLWVRAHDHLDHVTWRDLCLLD